MHHFRFHGPVKSASKTREKRRALFCGCNDDGVFCSRFQDIADVSPDAYADIGNIIDNSNSDSEDDFDDF